MRLPRPARYTGGAGLYDVVAGERPLYRAGTARLSGPDTAVVGGTTITFDRPCLRRVRHYSCLTSLASDAHPLTSDTIWQLDHLPERLMVLGGGSIGCELGQPFARLGSQVTIAEYAPTLLPVRIRWQERCSWRRLPKRASL